MKVEAVKLFLFARPNVRTWDDEAEPYTLRVAMTDTPYYDDEFLLMHHTFDFEYFPPTATELTLGAVKGLHETMEREKSEANLRQAELKERVKQLLALPGVIE